MHDSAAHNSVSGGSAPPPQIAYKVRDAAKQLSVSERTLWRLVAAGEIASFTFGASRRITHQALVEYVERQVAASAAEAAVPAAA